MPPRSSRRDRERPLGRPAVPSCSPACGWTELGLVVSPRHEPPGPSSSGTARGPPAGSGRGHKTDAPGSPTCPAMLGGVLGGVPRAIGWPPQMANSSETTLWWRRSCFLPGFRHQCSKVHSVEGRGHAPESPLRLSQCSPLLRWLVTGLSTPITAIRHRCSSFCTWPTYLPLSPESLSRCRLRWTTLPSPQGGWTPGRGARKQSPQGWRSRGRDRRRCTAGPRPQPWWWPTVGPTEGGAMEEGWPPTPGGILKAVEQVVKEPEVESQRARGVPRIFGSRVEPRAPRWSNWGPRWSRLKEQSPAETVGQSDEVQQEERIPEAMAGRRPTKVEPEGWGSPVELVDRRVTVEARELGAEVEPLGLRAEAESRPRRLEVEVRDTPALETLEDGRPTGLAPYR